MHHSRPRFLTLAFTASLLLGISIAGTPAIAAVTPVTWAYRATVTDISPGLLDDMSPFGSSPYMPGSLLLTGFYTFDSSTPGASGPTEALYPNTILSHTVQVRDLSNTVIYNSPLSTPPPQDNSTHNFIDIGMGSPDVPTPSDRYFVFFGDIPGSDVNGNPLIEAQLFLNGEQGIFNSLALPTTPPSINSFTKANQFILDFRNQNTASGGGFVIATITSLAPVPLPPAVILFGAGFVALIGLGARNWQQKKSGLA